MQKISMKSSDAADMALEKLRQFLCRDAASRLLHRAHAVFLVKSGLGEVDIARAFDVDPRTLQRWITAYDVDRLDGFRDGRHSGRPNTLTKAQWGKLVRHVVASMRSRPRGPRGPMVARPPRPRWTGTLLSECIKKMFDVDMGVRQCQRLKEQIEKQYPGLFSPH